MARRTDPLLWPIRLFRNDKPSPSGRNIVGPFRLTRLSILLLSLGSGVAQAHTSNAGHEECNPAVGFSNPTRITGYVQRIFPGNGAVVGWAVDLQAPAKAVDVGFYIEGELGKNDKFIGKAAAGSINFGIDWKYDIEGDHGFVFRIPDLWRDGVRHTLSVRPMSCGKVAARPMMIGKGNPFLLSSETRVYQRPVVGEACLDADTRCPSVASDYLAPNFPVPRGWSDGVNYFSKWGCRSRIGVETIERLNIIPLGSFGREFQKDSLFVDPVNLTQGGTPIIYFTATSKDEAPKWSLKKAVFDPKVQRWQIYSVLDSPNSVGGLSSQDGHGRYFVMNDYSLPGWGPSSPVPGLQNKIPGVSRVSASSERPTYPLTGSGPLGLTAMTNMLYPAETSGGVDGRTCIHMNPKLLGYDTNGVPHMLLANLWQSAPNAKPCRLPQGAPVDQLPAPGNYLYRYGDAKLGWQLDLSAGLISDGLHQSDHNQFMLTPKLLAGTADSLIVATWDGLVETFQVARTNTTRVLLDCKASGVHFGEATGSSTDFFFLAAERDLDKIRRRYHVDPSVLPVDIFHAHLH